MSDEKTRQKVMLTHSGMSASLTVRQLRDILNKAITDGHENRCVQIMEVEDGVPFMRDVVTANDAQDYDGEFFVIHPSADAKAPAWLGG